MKHHLVVIGVHADTPARAKLLKAVGATGYLACHWCGLSAVKLPEYPNHRYLGYSEPCCIKGGHLNGQHLQMVVDHDKLRLSAENMRWRDEEADRAAVEGMPNNYFTSGLLGIQGFLCFGSVLVVH